jgi:RNA polymerase sigma factor (sigma-70 family)
MFFPMKDYSQYKDSELIALLREDSPIRDNAFNIIYLKFISQVFGYCLYRSSSREEAEELLQDTWMKFYNSVRSGKSTDNILPFLLTIARNLSIDRFRSKNSKKNPVINSLDCFSLEQFADPFINQLEIEREEFLGLIKLSINYLDEKYKDALALYWFGNLSYEEIAAICGETVACIRTRLERAFQKLAVIMKPYFSEIK